jgi:hypothetical protein
VPRGLLAAAPAAALLRRPVSGSSIARRVSSSAVWKARHQASSSAGTSPLAARSARKS